MQKTGGKDRSMKTMEEDMEDEELRETVSMAMDKRKENELV